MHSPRPLCYRNVDGKILCPSCNVVAIKNGKSDSGAQRYHCRNCGNNFQEHYLYNACGVEDETIVSLVKEGCGIRSIARLLEISVITVLRRIRKVASRIKKPIMALGQSYEMDEMRTFIGTKEKPVWIAYAIRRDTGQVADFVVGARTNKTLGKVVATLLLSEAKQIRTDGLNNYASLIPKEQHSVRRYGINRIERKNLTLRTHLKRLGRRSISFSKCAKMLEACVKIYFWYEDARVLR